MNFRSIIIAPIMESEEHTRISHLLNIIILSSLILAITYSIVSLFASPFQVYRLLMSIGLILMILVSFALLRLRKIRATSLVVTILGLIFTTSTVLFTGGIRAPIALDEALNFMRKGDTLVVWKLDRLGRSLKHLIEIINNLMDNGMYFMSLQEKIDTTSTSGKLIFHIFAALAEFEREIISERSKAGLKAARARGRFGGRPKKLNEQQTQMVKKMWKDHTIPIDEICRTFDISRPTLYNYLKE